MKELNLFNKFCVLVITSLLSMGLAANAQENEKNKKEDKTEELADFLQSKNFVFVAQNAYPTGGRYINLTTSYGVKMSNDSLISDLPYFGRAYTASLNPSEGGFHFTSTNFFYQVKEKKKGGWDITIAPKDTRDVRQMFLSVSKNGYGSLQVTSNNRQLINFSGYLTSKNNFR